MPSLQGIPRKRRSLRHNSCVHFYVCSRYGRVVVPQKDEGHQGMSPTTMHTMWWTELCFQRENIKKFIFFHNKRIYSWNRDLITGLTSENDQEHNPQVRQFPLNMAAKLHFSIGNSAKVSTLEWGKQIHLHQWSNLIQHRLSCCRRPSSRLTYQF